ncbi:MAG: YraN family protein [Lachnospiraceae bacterium]
MGDNKRAVGGQYEGIAAGYLEKQGLVVLERNYRSRQGEIDLIARDGDYLVFVEVKFRRNDRMGSAQEAVDLRKQQKIGRTAGCYLYQHRYGDDVPCRFDVVAITGTKICWIKDAF